MRFPNGEGSSRPPPQAWVCAIGAALLWSTVASAFKIALRRLAPAEMLAVACLSSGTALLTVLALRGRLGDLMRQTRRDLVRSAFLGLLNPFLYYLVLFRAYDLLPAQEAQPLNNVWPIVLSLLAVPLLHRRLRPASLAALFVSFSGVVVISTRGDLTAFRVSNPAGCALALGSSVIWAVFWILNAADHRDQAVAMLTNFAFGTAYIFAALPFLPRRHGWTPVSFGSSVYIGLFEMGLTFLLWGRAVRLSRGAAAINNLAYLSPFLSLVFIHFVVGEEIRRSSVVGLTLIVAGIALQSFLTVKRPASK